MKLILRIPSSVLSQARQDLSRPHPFAFERVGFFRCRPTGRPDLVVITGYDQVPDEYYVHKRGAGACIDGSAIRAAMQRVLTDSVGQIHVHQHDHDGPPSPSPTDLADQPRLVASFRNVDPNLPHGFLILSETHACGSFVVPGRRQSVCLGGVSVVAGSVQFL